ncbi:MAG: hypothetical protein US85_C0016G0016 [Candidatus Shapirobacteria bacterium GW2011_GWF1_38_23]|nr:MAG: hypothetical protein US85_C0016G0016 [Candidatus Shapirobacteria bacterium GW2011_GWF1_38_23]
MLNNKNRKKCNGCEKIKPLSSFYYNSHNQNYSYHCKECDRKMQVAQFYKRYTPEQRREMWNKATKKSRKTNPAMWSAGKIVYRAVSSGVLKRQSCFICGHDKTDAHHEDYSKPLEVVWLCRNCHITKHLQKRQSL